MPSQGMKNNMKNFKPRTGSKRFKHPAKINYRISPIYSQHLYFIYIFPASRVQERASHGDTGLLPARQIISVIFRRLHFLLPVLFLFLFTLPLYFSFSALARYPKIGCRLCDLCLIELIYRGARVLPGRFLIILPLAVTVCH